MEVKSICRCCLSEGSYKDLDSSYTWFDQKEVYSKMLQECFDIVLSPNIVIQSGICDPCITQLRGSLDFKRRVLKSEKDFIKKLLDLHMEDDLKPKVKLERFDMDRGECDIATDDSDDYFLADAVFKKTLSSVHDIKEESPPKRKRSRAAKKLEKPIEVKTKRVETIRSLVTRLANSMNAYEVPCERKEKKKKSITIKKVSKEIKSIRNREKIKVVWKTNGHKEGKEFREKHKSNLHTILEFSNAVPFKNKTLLGYLCGYCDEAFPDPKDLRAHTENEHQKQRTNYKSCFDMTDYTVKLDITDLTCSLCDENMENLFIFKDHLVKKHNKTIFNDIKDHILQYKLKLGEIYDCALCTSTYETFKMLKQHMNKHYSNYMCSQCDSPFATKRSLNAHNTTHIEGNFKCDYCDKVFANKPKKQYHEKMKHFGARNISNCAYCNEPFRSYYQRNQHMIKVHNSEAQYKCNVCDKTYILKSLLMYHIKKNHLMEKNCQCTECGFRFFSKKALKAHMVKHTGERIYNCEVCNKSYARKYTLKEHMRIHLNDRRFKCSVCELSFVQKCSLKSHLLSNHGISMAASDITSG